MIEIAEVEAFRELFEDRADVGLPLDVSELGVRFGGIKALTDVTFQLRENEAMCVIGQNGAGKSTLLNAISGLVPAVPGSRVLLRENLISSVPAWKRARLGLARAFQDPPLVEHMSLVDNLKIGANAISSGSHPLERVFRPASAHAHEELIRHRADALLRLIGLDAEGGTNAASLPYGARKLLDIARGLMSQPQVLLLDEPTAGMDKAEQSVVKRLLALVRASERLAVLIVEHHMDIVREVSDRVLVLEAGRIALIGSPNDALSNIEGIDHVAASEGANMGQSGERR